MRILPIVISIIIIFSQLPAYGNKALLSADQVLIAKHRQLQENMELGEELNLHQQLMNTSQHLLKLTDEAFIASKKLEEYAYAVRYTGLVFDTPLHKVKQFQKSLKKRVNHPALKGFDSYMRVQEGWNNIASITTLISNIKSNQDLPPSTQNSLLALKSVGVGLQSLGQTPIIGAALQGYGDVIDDLSNTVINMAGSTTHLKQAGHFSNTDEVQTLKGLNRKFEYKKTPLWKYGIPLVTESPFTPGKDKYHIRHPNGQWTPINYSDVTEIAINYHLVYGRPINNSKIWNYINDTAKKRMLFSNAENKLEIKRLESILTGLPEATGKGRLAKFNATENRIIRLYKQLHLPLTYKNLSRDIRQSYQNPRLVERSLKRRVVRTYPEFKKYLNFLKIDVDNISIAKALKLFSAYREGKHLVSTLELVITDTKTKHQLANATVELRGPINKSVKARNGKVIISDLTPGKYNITIKSNNYERRSTNLVVQAMTYVSKKASLHKTKKKLQNNSKPITTKAPPPKKTKIKTPPTKATNSNCYASKYQSKVSNARKSNAKSNPASPTGMGISLLYASPKCESSFKTCQRQAWQLGADCRKSSSGDFKAVNKKCNTAVNKKVLECAQMEISCSESVYRASCNEKQTTPPNNASNDCYSPYAKKVKRALKANASNDPSGHMGIVLLSGSSQCTAAHKKCSNDALHYGARCRKMSHGGLDPVAVTKKCNVVVNTGWIECAQQEVKCSAQAFKRKCGM